MRFLEGMSSGSNGLHLTPTTPHIEEMEMPRLDFLIVGAGIAGLTCAYSLKQAGHNVRVVEAEKTLSKVLLLRLWTSFMQKCSCFHPSEL